VLSELPSDCVGLGDHVLPRSCHLIRRNEENERSTLRLKRLLYTKECLLWPLQTGIARGAGSVCGICRLKWEGDGWEGGVGGGG
jgi:hypothetical protein